MTEPTPTPPPEAADGPRSAPQAPDGAETHRDCDRGADGGPSVREAAADDRAYWDGEREGE